MYWEVHWRGPVPTLLKWNVHNTKFNVSAGINEETSHYILEHDEAFTTPEFAMTYSTNGKGGVSRAFHRWAREYKLNQGKPSSRYLVE